MRGWTKIAVLALLALGVWWLLGKLDIFPSIGQLLRPKEVQIDQTPVVLRQIKPLAQLVTITAYTEVAADSTMNTTVGERLKQLFNPFSLEVSDKRKLVVVGKVVINAGVNLEKLTPQHLFISKDSVHLQLPPAEIMDVIVNPSGTDIFLQEGQWSNDAVVDLKNKMGIKAVEDVKNRGILYQAEQRAEEVLYNFFTAAGFKKVVIVKSRLG